MFCPLCCGFQAGFLTNISRISLSLFFYKRKTNQIKKEQRRWRETEPCSVMSVLETIQSCCCWNLTWRKKIAGTSQHAIPPSAAHLLPRGAATCCRLSWTGPGRSGPSWPWQGPFNTTQNMDRIFPSRVSSPRPPPRNLPNLSSRPPLDVVQLSAKNSKAKKIFFFFFSFFFC